MIKTELLTVVLIICLLASRAHSQPRPPAKWKEYQDSLNHFLRLKDLNQCVFYYDKLIALDPRSTYLILGKGKFLYSVGEYRLAIREFTKVLKMNNEIADGHVRRGKAYVCLSQYDSALVDFNAAYGKYRYQDSAIFLYRGSAYDLMGNHTKAQLEYDSALTFHKSKKRISQESGVSKIRIGGFERSTRGIK